MGRPRPRRYQPSAPHGTVRRRPQPRVQIDRGLAWFCLWTAPRAEEQVAKALREAGLGVYVPMEALAVARRGRLVEVERPVLGRYVFVGLNAACPQWAAVYQALLGPLGWVPGLPTLGRVLKSADWTEIRVPASVLQRFANGLGASLAGVSTPDRCWEAGQPVKALYGPLEGFDGAYYDSDDGRVRALFNLLGRQTLVEFTLGQLEAA
jgi:transcription antitermination factor NusG